MRSLFGLQVMAILLPQVIQAQAAGLTGTWQLVSRTDSGVQGVVPADGDLGSDPLALLIYDRAGNVSVQLMARHRDNASRLALEAGAPTPSNNSASVGGYDAYFGHYAVDTLTHTITHELVGALSSADVGRHLTRHYQIVNDTLRLSFEARRIDGQAVQRRLVWVRVVH